MWRAKIIIRMLGIQRVLVRHGLDDIIRKTHFLRPLRFFFYLFPRSGDCSDPLGKRIRIALQDLGPIFVKFGQAVSTRRDLLPPDIADELAMLQDRVPPFPGEQARAIVESTLGRPITELFVNFDERPLASASIAQVHSAELAAAAAAEAEAEAAEKAAATAQAAAAPSNGDATPKTPAESPAAPAASSGEAPSATTS